MWLRLAFLFSFGLCIGSFLNVCIYRMPLDLSVVTPRSSCPGCKKLIPWYRNIPLLSFFVLRARCPDCQSKISWRYPFIELLGGLIFLAVPLLNPDWRVWPFHAYLLCSLVVTTFVDLDHWIIPDKITLPGIVIGFLSSFIIPGFHWLDSVLGIIFGGGSLLFVGWIYAKLTQKEGIGGGDIKYLAMAGAFLGLQDVVLILLLSSVVGSLLGIVMVIARKGDGKTAIPFGPFLAVATLIVFLFGDSIWEWYLRFQHVV